MSYSKLYTYDDFLSFLSDSGYGETAKKQKEAVDSSVAAQIKELEAQKKGINTYADDLARKAYISYLSSSKDLPEKISASGLNGGIADNMYLSLANEYQNNYNDIELDRQNKLYDTDSSILKAKASGDSALKDSMSKLYSEAVDRFLDVRENDEKRNYDSYYKDLDYASKEEDRKAEKAESDARRKLELAKIALEAGDREYLKKLGINLSGSHSTSGSSSGSGSGGSHGASSSLLEGLLSGVLAGSDITDMTKRLDYAIKLAEYGDYSLFCKITGLTEEQAALQFADEVPGYTDKDIKDAAKLFMTGDYSPNVLSLLKKAYPNYTYRQIWTLWESIALSEWYMDVSGGYMGPEG